MCVFMNTDKPLALKNYTSLTLCLLGRAKLSVKTNIK